MPETELSPSQIPPPVPPQSAPSARPIDVGASRFVHFQDGRSYALEFRPATAKEWATYGAQSSLQIREENSQPDGRRFSSDDRNGAMDLAAALLKGWTGYPEGVRPPVKHLLFAGLQMVNVAVDREAQADFMNPPAGLWFVPLRTLWGDAEGMYEYSGRDLLHAFRQPDIEQWRKLNRAVGDTIRVGGSRDGRIIVPSRFGTLMELYDELIESVCGYSVSGAPLQEAEDIRRYMDGAHKVVAVRELFSEVEG